MFDLFHSIPEQGLLFFIGSVRPLTFFVLVPFLGGEAVPGQLRFALAFLLALFAYPAFADLSPPDAGFSLALWLTGIIGKELLVGFMQAYCASIIFWAMLSVGFIMDNQRGAGMAQATDPASGEASSLFGAFLHQIAIYLLFSGGAFVHILLFLLAGYAVCPPGFAAGSGMGEGIPLFLMGQFSRLMLMTVVFAAPVMLICLLSDVGLGLVNRFAPQLNVFFLSMPIKSALGMFMIFLYLKTLLPLVSRELFSIGGHMEALWSILR
jgi:type III secretion protein T